MCNKMGEWTEVGVCQKETFMIIKPVRAEYLFSIRNHEIRAIAEHSNESRIISFIFDDKFVAKKTIEAGKLLSDDDYIRDIVIEYCQNHIGVYADIFKNHSNKVSLVSKIAVIEIENYGIKLNGIVKVLSDKYEIQMSTENGDDMISGSFTSDNFPEVLEKVRLFIRMLEGLSSELTDNIDELSNDKIEELIKWEEN